ncbi:MAG: hypothetical protein IPI38_11515 [Gemmatimonadetes bacterium]|nr:hypothetical protein [Gemmatimonadota bacterium]MBK6781006.1 hypothetical protein [Gemmatimonadota bacterium]MBK7351456.1 hypothetical protein [Gemmatimonadota bacterium]MBK7716032.1 hypothetical protein [Gemmatimonadota bacterium]MBK7786619.1 hypothetical protein [Gemmatimonadota bacterium]
MRFRDFLSDLLGTPRGPRRWLSPYQAARVRRIHVAERDLDNWVATAILEGSGGDDVRVAAATRADALLVAHAMAAEVARTGRILEVTGP